MGAKTYIQGSTGLFSIETPLGTDELLLQGFKGSEGISRLFHFDLNFLSENPNIDYTKIIGKPVTITLNQVGATPRYISGVISRFGQGGSGNTFTTYYAEMVPWLWFLTRTANCQIFQSKKIPDIITQVFDKFGYHDYSNKTNGTYDTREYCVQYRETSFNFVSRLMEECGIYYFFQHTQGKHTLVLADDATVISDCPGQSEFQVDIENSANADNDLITGWRTERELRTGKYTLTDYNFETPSSSLLATSSTVDSIGGNSSLETFDYPGKYTTSGEGNTLVKTRMEEEEVFYNVSRGTSNARSMVSGYKFTLKEHYRGDLNDTYLLTDIEHSARTDTYGTSRGGAGDRYSNSFRCIPASVPFRPLRVTPRPTVMGPQPAIIVGKSGEEIYTDKYGRVKVQFYWDRVGKKDENSSCWIRVSQFWAGKNWGAIFLPRIGQEVIVDFLEGDPDQPIITGRVYNAEMMPPGELPGSMNVSGYSTRSTKGGTSDNFNSLTMDDTKGSELILLHAEKDLAIVTEHDDSLSVGNDQTITIKNNRTETVSNGNESVTIKSGKRTHTVSGDDSLTVQSGNRSVTVSTGNDTHTVSTGNREVDVNTGNDTHNIKTGNRNVTISLGNDSLTISVGNQTTNVDVGSISTTAMQGITLTCGGSSITIGPASIDISSPKISVSGEAEVQVSGAMINVEADGILGLTGAMTNINS